MARIPQDHLDRIKQDISLLKLAESQGYEVHKQGKDYVVLCPFHEEKTPSCVISTKTNLFNCFGCGAGGSVIDWVMKTQGVSFRLACELLQKDLGLITEAKPVKRSTAKKLSSTLAEDLLAASPGQALGQVMAYYHQCLLDSPEALVYLEQRGLNDPELIKAFKLGYANRTLAYHIPAKNREAGGRIRETLQQAGILRDSGHEHFNGSLVVPVFNRNGQVVEAYGRKLLNNLRKGTPKHLYLPGEHGGVWNAEGLAGHKDVIICESLIDAMTFWCAGYRNVTASYGTQGFTEDHLTTFKQLNLERVLIAYDRDEAGDRAAEALAKTLQQEGFECFRILFPKGLDANEHALKAQPASKSLGMAIRQAQWLGAGQAPARPVATVASAEGQSGQESAIMKNTQNTEAQDVAIDPGPDSQSLAEGPALPASPVPETLAATVACEIQGQDVILALGDRRYRVRGFDPQGSPESLKIQLMVNNEQGFHADKLDLYSSKQRQVFINQASAELGLKDEVIKKDLGQVLLSLEAQQSQSVAEPETPTLELSHEDREAALSLLRDPNLLNRILADVKHLGLVGEDSNTLVGYLACVSRKLDKPLAVMIQSTSAAGKSSLMDSILALMPEEERLQYSAMTGQSLFYMGETHLKHKILAISEEEGASNASYALKLLQSEGEVTIASTSKDESSGNLITKDYKVEGPVMLLMTTTAIDIDEELMNRCLVLSVNETREQTQAIHQAQRHKRTLAGLQAKVQKQHILQSHHHAQRLLKPLAVINPYADQLTFLDDKTRTRRDHEKYLTLIDSIALLHQYQRNILTLELEGAQVDYIEATLEDIEHANRLAHDVLGRTLDELPPQTRKLLTYVQDWVNTQSQAQAIDPGHLRFSRRQVRDLCGWSETQVRVHLQRLVDMEYLLVHRGGRGQSFEYELLYSGEGDQGEAFLMRLLDTERLQKPPSNNTMMATSRGSSPGFAGSSRPQRGVVADCENAVQPVSHGAYSPTSRSNTQNALRAV